MRETLLYLLLFTYSASILKPAMPYLTDALAHTFYYAEHVKTVHFENGKYHVHNELIKQNNQNNADDTNTELKKISLPDDHLALPAPLNFFSFSSSFDYAVIIVSSNLQVFKDVPYAPPRC